ncbi:ribosome biogenesis GTPase A [mine drainage metagenome]|uniref:Ribosome biogenesis GTPase A n=1 Tax=mine drainage metagenome TaxID=410659 RepID=A0A1J5PIP7_9ZZZZ
MALELLDTLIADYPALLHSRFGFEAVAGMPSEQALEAIGRKRGALQAGQRVNLQKAAGIVIDDLRSGALGRITLETPQQFGQWLAAGQTLDAQRQVKKEAIELDRKIRFKKIPRPDRRNAS